MKDLCVKMRPLVQGRIQGGQFSHGPSLEIFLSFTEDFLGDELLLFFEDESPPKVRLSTFICTPHWSLWHVGMYYSPLDEPSGSAPALVVECFPAISKNELKVQFLVMLYLQLNIIIFKDFLHNSMLTALVQHLVF